MMLRNIASAAVRTSAYNQTTSIARSTTAAVNVRMSSDSVRPAPWASKTPTLTAIGTRRIFDSEHDEFRRMARKFFEEKIKPHHAKWEEDGMISREAWLQAGELGLLGSATSEEWGGVGADLKYAAVVWEEQAYSLCSGPGYAMHSDIVMPYLSRYGTDEQKKKYLPKMATGEWIGALAMTEPHAGSDLKAIKTTAKPVDGGYILNGSKVFITNGQMSDVVIVAAKTNVEKGAHGVSLLVVESGMEGFTKGKNLKKLGMKANDTSELFFDNVFVPSGNLLGKENAGFYQMMQDLPQERLLIAVMSLASSEAIFEKTRQYLQEREAFGAPLIKMQLLKHRMAEMKTSLAFARAFVDDCIEALHEGRLDTSTASMAKARCTDLQNEVNDKCLQLHGGWGYMWEYDVCRAFADGRVQAIYGGTNEIMNDLIARDIQQKPE